MKFLNFRPPIIKYYFKKIFYRQFLNLKTLQHLSKKDIDDYFDDELVSYKKKFCLEMFMNFINYNFYFTKDDLKEMKINIIKLDLKLDQKKQEYVNLIIDLVEFDYFLEKHHFPWVLKEKEKALFKDSRTLIYRRHNWHKIFLIGSGKLYLSNRQLVVKDDKSGYLYKFPFQNFTFNLGKKYIIIKNLDTDKIVILKVKNIDLLKIYLKKLFTEIA